jgi:hypothetical protein
LFLGYTSLLGLPRDQLRFGYTAGQIREDARNNPGRSLILARILAEKKKGRCRCADTNPKGR